MTKVVRYTCTHCDGTGEVECGICCGEKILPIAGGTPPDLELEGYATCPECGGIGKVPCKPCKGTGTVETLV